VKVLSNAFGNKLQHETQRNYALSVQQQIQLALPHRISDTDTLLFSE
jgi:hypothetical protein